MRSKHRQSQQQWHYLCIQKQNSTSHWSLLNRKKKKFKICSRDSDRLLPGTSVRNSAHGTRCFQGAEGAGFPCDLGWEHRLRMRATGIQGGGSGQRFPYLFVYVFKKCLMWAIFQSLLTLLQHCLFCVLAFWPRGTRDLGSPTRDGTHAVCTERLSLNRCAARKAPHILNAGHCWAVW